CLNAADRPQQETAMFNSIHSSAGAVITTAGLLVVQACVLVLPGVAQAGPPKNPGPDAKSPAAGGPPSRKYSNLERLAPVRLAAVHADVQKLKKQRTHIPPMPGLNDYRCILHAHAEDSTHTGGTLPEM